jgi:hypothetical protein
MLSFGCVARSTGKCRWAQFIVAVLITRITIFGLFINCIRETDEGKRSADEPASY